MGEKVREGVCACAREGKKEQECKKIEGERRSRSARKLKGKGRAGVHED